MTKNLIDVFTDTARQYPDRIAVKDCKSELTYRQLDERSNAVARALHPGNVLIVLPRRCCFMIATIGTLKAGGCYAACNIDYPAERVSYIAENADAKTIITTTAVWDKLKDELPKALQDKLSLMLIDDIDWETMDTSTVNRATWEQEAYMLYTSGTTGKPKGVIHTIASLTLTMQAFACWDEDRATPVREAVFGDLCFAASQTDLYTPFFTGGSVYIIDEATRMDMSALASYINENLIDRMFMGSSIGVAMLGQFDLHLGQLILGGEKVTAITPEMMGSVDVICQYGASEGFPIAMHHVTGTEENIPVGTQSDDDVVYVLDQDRQPVAKGQMGEIYFSSHRIAKGYRNLPELTAERFIDDPWRTGYKMLRTGDLGYVNEQGELMHCGRADNMFKIHGQRVEPGEVENVAQQFPGMGDSVCAKKTVNGDDTVCLFFEAATQIDNEALRTFMARQLTHYMVPSIFVQLEHLPRNARGKLDRKALPEPASGLQMKMVAPTTDNEKMLFEITAGVLETRQFGITDDLRAIGLNSIRAMKIAAEAMRKGIVIKATDFMKTHTIRDVLQVNMQMAYWWNDYDERKPIMVFTHGIALTSNMRSKLDLLSERFSVFTIENVEEHYQYIFQDESYKEVILFYDALLQTYLPENAQVFAFGGVSWGGSLAYSLASMWSQRTGQKPVVLMADTLLNVDAEFNMALINGTLDSFCAKRHIPHDAFNESFVKRATIVAMIEQRGKVLPHYDGHVILMNALQARGVNGQDNVALWEQLASHLTVVDYDTSHDVLCVDPAYATAFCQHLFDALATS